MSILYTSIYCITSTSIVLAQSVTNSPYSRFGLGELQYHGFANNLAMGGIYSALQNDTVAPYFINVSNPASLATNRLTAFDFGVRSNTTLLETDDKRFLSNQTALSYMAMAFPVAKWWGSSFGLLPYSNVGYKIYTKQEIDSVGTVNYSYEGEGGINQLFWANGFRIKNFYLGANAAYLFGDLQFSSRDSFPKASNFMNTKLIQTTRVSDLNFNFGVQYKKNFKQDWNMTLGFNGSAETNLNVKRTTFAATYKNDFGVEVIKDTVVNDADVPDTVTVPMAFGGGVVFKKGESFLIGFDYSMQDWSSFNDFGQQGLLRNSSRMALGVQFIPGKGKEGVESYFRTVRYRAGLRYSDSYLEINQTALTDMAVSIGAGFPLRKVRIGEIYSQSVINVGIEVGQRGTTDQQLIRERYVNLFLSFTLNDRWFIKRKYD